MGHRLSTAIAFGSGLAKEYRHRIQTIQKNEVEYFLALKGSLEQLERNRFTIDVLHGSKSQVSFSGRPNTLWARSNARCELADLMIVTFQTNTSAIRITFVQIKLERKPVTLSNHSFKLGANLEQWDLLSRRPDISGVGKFKPAQNTLSGAELSSVGSFIFLFPPNANMDLYYASADELTINANPRQKYSHIIAPSQPSLRQTGRYQEAKVLTNCRCFGTALYSQTIGTPINDEATLSQPARNYRRNLRKWLYTEIAEHPNERETSGEAVKGLLKILRSESSTSDSSKLGRSIGGNIVIIKTDEQR